ncbi:hypothetical protein LJC37_01260 [Bacteroidales bacterium OttesenSCG-928-E04]|nr:hypothetical protein [Bacteroidales bacterium OttesenSCG-928-E04]
MRVEIELPRDATDYKTIPVGENGVIIFYEGQGTHIDSATWVFIQYDTNLVKQKSHVIKTPANLVYNIATHEGEKMHLFLLDKFQKKTTLNSYFLTLNFATGEYNLATIEGFYDENINFAKKVNDNFFLISYLKRNYDVYHYDAKLNQIHTLKFGKEYIQSIEFCEVDTFMRRISWGMVLELSSNNTVMHYIETDYSGSIISKLPFPRYTGYSYMTARMMIIDSTQSLVIGTYIDDEDKRKSLLPTGIYTMRMIDHTLQDPDFFSDTQIKSNDSTVAKPVKKDQNLQALVGNIKRTNGNYTLVTEIFYPEYEYTSSNYGYDPFYYGTRSTPTTNFLGYRFLHANIITFDENGQLIWSQHMPFRNVLTLNLFPRISTFQFENNTVIYYIFNATLSYMMVNRHTVIEPVTSKNIILSNSNEAVDYSRNVQINNWYGNYFLVSGYQNLKGKSRSSKTKRYVFYMNKMEYR